jgi:hypothetical protein
MATDTKPVLLEEIGRTGLNQSSGYIYEEYQPEWKGYFKSRTIKRMLHNSTCGAILFAIDMLLRQVTFTAKPASDDNKDREAADFIEGCRNDMSTSWPDLISEIQSFLPWGWDYHEIVYKERRGDNPGVYKDGRGIERSLPISKFNDGKIGWRKWATRSQDSLDHWEFDDEGGVSALVQSPPPDYQTRTIPIDKALLFRTAVNKGNPEGESIFRRAWQSYYFLTHISRIEAIGIEREFTGFPVFWVPPNIINGTSDEDVRANAAFKNIGKNIKSDEEACLLMPLVYDQNGNKLYDFELAASKGQRLFDTDKPITRYKHEILMSSMADFLLLGAQQVGSYALSADKTEMFSVALTAYLDSMCGVINRHGIPRLLRLNSMPGQAVLEHGKVEQIDLKTLLALVSELGKLNLVFNDEQVNYILKMIDDGFPLIEKETTE